jgi:type I restriction enzyme S subunit
MIDTLLDRFDLLLETHESIPKLRRFILRLAFRGKLSERRPKDSPVDALVEEMRTEKQRLYNEGEIRKPRTLDALKEKEEWHHIPSEWKWVKVGRVGRIVGGSTPSTSNSEYWAEDGIAWLTPGDLGNHEAKRISRGDRDISEKGLDSCSATLLPPGSVLFSSRAPIGYVAIAADELATNQGFKNVRPYKMEMNNYIYWFLKYAGKRINDEASGTTFTEVSGTDLANIPFPLPPIEEQKRIAETIDQLMEECDSLGTLLKKRDGLRSKLVDSVLDKAVQNGALGT